MEALGYPARGTLAAWIGELNPESRQRVVGRAGSVTRAPELKKAAVLELCTRQGSARAVAQKIGVSRPTDRKSVVWGKSVSVRVDLGGRRIIKKKNKKDRS